MSGGSDLAIMASVVLLFLVWMWTCRRHFILIILKLSSLICVLLCIIYTKYPF